MTFKTKFLFPFCCILLTCISALAQGPFSDKNVNYHYNVNNEVKLDHRIFFNENSAELYLKFSFRDSIDYADKYNLSLCYFEDYQKESPISCDTLNIRDLVLARKSRKLWLKHDFRIPEKGELLMVKLHNTENDKNFYFDITIDQKTNYSNADLMVFHPEDSLLPLIQNFHLTTDSLRIRERTLTQDSLWVYYYGSKFDVATPPMIVNNDGSSKSLNVDSLFYIRSNEKLCFSNPGLYFVQKDTNSLEGISLRVEAPPFPKYGTFDYLIKPLVYISTKSERNKVIESNNLRTAFQNYWIEVNESKNTAKNTINHFYNRVAEANYYFTNYKEGWKTDMGMTYIVFGPPDHVFKRENYEEWVYTSDVTLPTLRFTFVKIKNVFSEHHFSLIRDKKYDERWFHAVEKWRSGEINQ